MIKNKLNNLKKLLKNFVKKMWRIPPTSKEWIEWNNASYWVTFTEKWFVILEWLTILSVFEYFRKKVDIWQIDYVLAASWLLFYFYLNSVVVLFLARLAFIKAQLIYISISVSGLISVGLYVFVKDVVKALAQ